MCLEQYNKDLAKVFESVQVDLQGISLLEQAGRDALINFADSGIGYVDYDSYLAEVRVRSSAQPELGGVMGIFFPCSVWKVKPSESDVFALFPVFQLNKGVTVVDLLTFSADLEAQADQLVSRGGRQSSLLSVSQCFSPCRLLAFSYCINDVCSRAVLWRTP